MIRKLTIKDKDNYIAMSKAFYHSSAVLSNIKPSHVIQTFDEIISDSPYVEGYIIEHEHDIAGYALLSFTYSNAYGGLILLLEELYIKPNYQGMGLGKQMMKYLENEYQEEIVGIRLEVTQDNEIAVSMYHQNGFNQIKYLSMYKKCE